MSILNSIIKTLGPKLFKIGGNSEDYEQFYTEDELKRQRTLPIKPMTRGYEFSNVKIAGVECLKIKRLHTKSNKLFISIHGGGFVGGSALLNAFLIKSIIKKTHYRAISIEYRLAPENPYPAALDDCYQVYRECLKRYQPENIILGGESAGGNLTIALLMRLRDEGIPLPKVAFVSSPCLDQTYSLTSHYENEVVDISLTLGDMKKFTYNYTKNSPNIDLTHPYVSPLYGDMKGLPPIIIFAATDEILVDDSRNLYNKLQEAGVPCEYHEYTDTFHAFTVVGNITREGADSVAKMIAFFKQHLNQ
jgi:epsilon-lactone hydrolase